MPQREAISQLVSGQFTRGGGSMSQRGDLFAHSRQIPAHGGGVLHRAGGACRELLLAGPSSGCLPWCR